MTTKQRREHKQGNQLRKKVILKLAKESRHKGNRHYWATAGICQNGRFT